MAAPSKYPSPEVQLHELARDAIASGEAFRVFWERVVREHQPNVLTSTPEHKRPPEPCILWPSDSNDRITWQGAIYESREGWRRVFEGEPALPRESALKELAAGLDALREAMDEAAEAEEETADCLDPALAVG